MKRLIQLNPSLTWSPTAVIYTHQLAMDCPACGPIYRLVINCVIGTAPGVAGVWGLALPTAPQGDGYGGWTMTPSYQNNGHGRKKDCAVHFSIVDGAVVP